MKLHGELDVFADLTVNGVGNVTLVEWRAWSRRQVSQRGAAWLMATLATLRAAVEQKTPRSAAVTTLEPPGEHSLTELMDQANKNVRKFWARWQNRNVTTHWMHRD